MILIEKTFNNNRIEEPCITFSSYSYKNDYFISFQLQNNLQVILGIANFVKI